MATCPVDPHVDCISPGPVDGGCCKITPVDRPVRFCVGRRNVGHWDVTTQWGRAFRIRGDAEIVLVLDERKNDALPDFPREPLRFRSLGAAMLYISEELMREQKA
jgi:hypothetical protein